LTIVNSDGIGVGALDGVLKCGQTKQAICDILRVIEASRVSARKFGERLIEMSSDAKKRLKRLRDELDDIRQDYRVLCFALIRCSSKTSIPWTQPNVQQFFRTLVWENSHGNTTLTYAEDRSWFDPLESGSECILWSGDPTGVKKLQEWGDTFSSFLDNNRKLAQKLGLNYTGGGYAELLARLCHIAQGHADLSKIIEERTVLDLAKCLNEGESVFDVPRSLLKLTPSPTFSFLEPHVAPPNHAASFVLQVIDQLLGTGPRSEVPWPTIPRKDHEYFLSICTGKEKDIYEVTSESEPKTQLKLSGETLHEYDGHFKQCCSNLVKYRLTHRSPQGKGYLRTPIVDDGI
jgi:hypothetical protein